MFPSILSGRQQYNTAVVLWCCTATVPWPWTGPTTASDDPRVVSRGSPLEVSSDRDRPWLWPSPFWRQPPIISSKTPPNHLAIYFRNRAWNLRPLQLFQIVRFSLLYDKLWFCVILLLRRETFCLSIFCLFSNIVSHQRITRKFSFYGLKIRQLTHVCVRHWPLSLSILTSSTYLSLKS